MTTNSSPLNSILLADDRPLFTQGLRQALFVSRGGARENREEHLVDEEQVIAGRILREKPSRQRRGRAGSDGSRAVQHKAVIHQVQ